MSGDSPAGAPLDISSVMPPPEPTQKDSSQPPSVRVWDVPTRLFHWAIVILIAVSWLSADRGYMRVHLWSGLALLTLVVFRIVWGFVGSTTSRFSNFIHSPASVLGYLRQSAGAQKRLYAGHNPAGGLMVVVLISALCAQIVTGLLANNDINFNSPLATLVSKEVSDEMTVLHGSLFDLILVLVWMHVVAVFFYLFVKGENLVWPMFTGRKHRAHVPGGVSIRFTSVPLALFLIGFCALLVWWFLWP